MLTGPNAPDGGDGLDVAFEEVDDALGVKVDDGDGAIEAAGGDELAAEEAARIEARGEGAGVEADVDGLGELGGKGIEELLVHGRRSGHQRGGAAGSEVRFRSLV
jgi:hypothetical protein